MKYFHLPLLACLYIPPLLTFSQEPILSYGVNALGQVQLEVASSPANYYVLQVAHTIAGPYHAVSMLPGQNGTTTLSEPLSAYSQDHYRVLQYNNASPFDTDGDGLNDLEEYSAPIVMAPFNSAPPIDTGDGATSLPDRAAFEAYALKYDSTFALPELAGMEIIKFFLLDKDSTYPQLYFMHPHFVTHTDFANAIGAAGDPSMMTGLIVYYPHLVAKNGTLGTYRFNFEPQYSFTFPYVQRVEELLAANMPFVENNLCYYPFPGTSLPLYFTEKAAYDSSRVCVLFDEDIYGNAEYLPFHLAEGYGMLHHITDLSETPGSRDVVIYESLPNSLSRVGGIITTVTQTPLSHVNLRAIQDNVPNAYIRNALLKPEITALLGKQVYYKAEPDTFILREASMEEVEAFYASQRPDHVLLPIRNLSQTHIKPLDNISFYESASFGVKCSNVATLRTFGFPDGTIPNGYGIPFYFYDEFMKYNNFYDEVSDMLNDEGFKSDYTVREQMLTDFRDQIKVAPMPDWMINELGEMQSSFPSGSSIRCRSSTNNEDLPGFSGAGLYDSFTQHPDEGHIAKSIKQVFASMWNYRAFEERDFFRVDHFHTAMGVLVTPNFEGELANGVGVSTDPFYQSKETYYLNTQIGEDLVTNPGALSVPEEILLSKSSKAIPSFALMQPSNLVHPDSLVMKEMYLNQMREFLSVIHNRFRVLYDASDADGFAMEIEYKISASGQLVIKQARPWAAYNGTEKPNITQGNSIIVYPNPFSDVIHISAEKNAALEIRIFNMQGQLLYESTASYFYDPVEIPVSELPEGFYLVDVWDETYEERSSGVVVK